ncbi:MAG TPA: thioredoxin domain-containing protein [Polyangiaceae bacterium]|mgnify:CR=1 FL=1|nr:thioredoxin domain-containing protein [Polyangiaceae bacterium]
MRDRILLVVLRVSIIVALAASAGLLVDYLARDAAYCGTVGCLRVKLRYGWVGGRIPVPALGVVAFTVLFAMTLARRLPGIARLGNTAAIAGGAIGALLLLHQGLIVGAFCRWCVVADVAAMVAAAAAAGLLVAARAQAESVVPLAAATRGDAPEEPLRPWAWAVLGVLAVAAPILWPLVRVQPPVPRPIRERYVPGKINVVELSDFECDACRALHPRLTALLAEYGDRAHFVRLLTPLASHPNSFDAATAAACAEPQGNAEEMADALFRADSLDPAEIDRIAAALGLDPVAFADCRADPATRARVERERALLPLGGMPMTPKLYVGGTRIVGAQPDLVLRDAFERAGRGEDGRGIPAGAFAALLGAAGALVIFAGTRRRRRARAGAGAAAPEWAP